MVPASATPTEVLTMIPPSPGASQVQVTKQSQIVTSYVPQCTLCELPPLAFFPFTRQPSALPTTVPYSNYSISVPPANASCTTIFSETETMVCATVISDLTTTYTVSQCPEDIIFSTRYGYVLATPIPALNSTGNSTALGRANPTVPLGTAPSIETLTAYYLVPWQELTSAAPPADVDLKVCRTFANGTQECIRQYEIWHTSLVTSTAATATTVSSVNFTTTISGPSQFIMETFVANITEVMTTISLSTTIDLEYQTEWETTISTTRAMTPVSTGPTVYRTKTVEEVTLSSTQHVTSTITRRITSTITAGTTTITLSSSSDTPVAEVEPTSTVEPNYVSMFCIGR